MDIVCKKSEQAARRVATAQKKRFYTELLFRHFDPMLNGCRFFLRSSVHGNNGAYLCGVCVQDVEMKQPKDKDADDKDTNMADDVDDDTADAAVGRRSSPRLQQQQNADGGVGEGRNATDAAGFKVPVASPATLKRKRSLVGSSSAPHPGALKRRRSSRWADIFLFPFLLLCVFLNGKWVLRASNRVCTMRMSVRSNSRRLVCVWSLKRKRSSVTVTVGLDTCT